MAHYVKFMRGTWQAFNKLEEKDTDTLYFISEHESGDTLLYLGSKLIAGGDADISVSSINDLKDVLLTEDIVDGSILIYDAENKQWVNATIEQAISVFIGASSSSNGKAGLVPAPEAGKTNLFLRSDGTWAPLPEDNKGISNVLEITNESNLRHADIIANATTDLVKIKGDVIIIKELITEGKYQHSAYMYDGEKWCAMDGSYDADTVYFDSDFVFTEAVGTVTIPEGQGSVTVDAAGKNVKEFFASIFAQEANPTITDPSLTVTIGHNTSYEVGTKVTPSASVTLDPGSYEFGPDTGVTVKASSLTDSVGKTIDGTSGTFDELEIGDSTSYKITAKVTYTDGAVPNTNLNNPYEDGQIKEKEISKNSSTLTGYRKLFYGTLTHKNELTSDIIRGLPKSAATAGNGKSYDLPVAEDALRAVFAYPATLKDLEYIRDVAAMNANILDSWKSTTVMVEGANGYEAKEYKVYYLDYADAYGKTNTYTVKITN